ncbi:hypothetical protein B0H16DRAFT_1472551 [Mycena metata]|uniref:Uncharacterized protein n=1 Tax=Mycena metata TaxID=1033252 RepID=A0AAD7HN97_9AGAR|nr:hypothetical protein B0H16DRAFT_1472551 [Mycena metata]
MPSIKINGKNVSIPPLPLRPRTPAQKYTASNTREPHHGPLSSWLKNTMATCFPRRETDTTDLDSDKVLCSVHMRYSKDGDVPAWTAYLTKDMFSKLMHLASSPSHGEGYRDSAAAVAIRCTYSGGKKKWVLSFGVVS